MYNTLSNIDLCNFKSIHFLLISTIFLEYFMISENYFISDIHIFCIQSKILDYEKVLFLIILVINILFYKSINYPYLYAYYNNNFKSLFYQLPNFNKPQLYALVKQVFILYTSCLLNLNLICKMWWIWISLLSNCLFVSWILFTAF